MDFTVGFDNPSVADAGYSPFLDVILPATGTQGNDGITFQNATYLGTPLTATVRTFGPSGQLPHPLAKTGTGEPVMISGTPGDQLVVLALPFGSFTPGQPTIQVHVQALVSPLANLGFPLNLQAQGGFALGNDPPDHPTLDPSILGPTVTSTATPALLKLTKQYLGPESEAATGPSFPQHYLITVDVAAGQTVTNLDITDLLPANLQFVQVVQSAVHGVLTTTTAISSPSTTTPGGMLTRRFASVTGDASANDASMLFEFYGRQRRFAGAGARCGGSEHLARSDVTKKPRLCGTNQPITLARLVPTAGEAEGQTEGCRSGADLDPALVQGAAVYQRQHSAPRTGRVLRSSGRPAAPWFPDIPRSIHVSLGNSRSTVVGRRTGTLFLRPVA